MSKARVAAFEAALTDRVHLGADNYGPVVGRTTRAMGDGRTLQQTRCHCGSIWDGHTWGPGKKEWEAHVGSMRHLAWVQSASRKRAAPPYAGPPRAPPPKSAGGPTSQQAEQAAEHEAEAAASARERASAKTLSHTALWDGAHRARC